MPYNDILLIDDDSDDREIFMNALEKIGSSARFTVMQEAEEALQKLDAGDLIADLIFLDLNLPLMTGQQFLAEIKTIEHLKNIPIVIISTSANPETIRSTRALGALDYVIKPNRFEELVNILVSIL